MGVVGDQKRRFDAVPVAIDLQLVVPPAEGQKRRAWAAGDYEGEVAGREPGYLGRETSDQKTKRERYGA